MLRKIVTTATALLLLLTNVHADEGMWLPTLLKGRTLDEMKKAGMRLTPEEIYSVNKASLKDAIVGLGSVDANFRTSASASFISDKGLVITNYHCVLPYIEKISTMDRDFLTYGCWAENQAQEAYLFGLQINQLVRIEDVTSQLTKGLEGLSSQEREKEITNRTKEIVEKIEAENAFYKASVSTIFAGSQYIVSIYKFFPDVRIVAAPPMSIGKFAGDDDNWQWPRHTGDFALIRVYADANNNPAPYSKDNVPYKPVNSLTISLAGVTEGDFAMVYGFPATTRQYIPSYALQNIIFKDTQAKADIRGDKLRLLREAMEENDTLRMRYTSRANVTANTYLRWKGEIVGVSEMKLVEQKQKEEEAFQAWVDADPKRKATYGTVLADMEAVYSKLTVYHLVDAYFNEAALQGAEVIPFAGKFEKLMAIFRRKTINPKAVEAEVKRLIPLTEQFFRNWDYELDRNIYRNLIYRYYQNVPVEFHTEELNRALSKFDGNVDAYATYAYQNSLFTHKDSLISYLNNILTEGVERMEQDPVYKMSLGFYNLQVTKVINQRGKLQKENSDLYTLYMQGLFEMNKDKHFFPDANRTQRISFGKVTGCQPEDGQLYAYATTFDGAMAKYYRNRDNPQYFIPRKLRELHEKRDYGRYGTNGVLYTCFLTNAHTTSGNSGSAVLNKDGQLIGLNFDRIWEGVASDYKYNPAKSRSIAVDVRYVLFMVDKYSPSRYVLDELKIAK